MYLNIIRAYDAKHGAVRANLNYEQLCRIMIQIPSKSKIEEFRNMETRYLEHASQVSSLEDELASFVSSPTD